MQPHSITRFFSEQARRDLAFTPFVLTMEGPRAFSEADNDYVFDALGILANRDCLALPAVPHVNDLARVLLRNHPREQATYHEVVAELSHFRSNFAQGKYQHCMPVVMGFEPPLWEDVVYDHHKRRPPTDRRSGVAAVQRVDTGGMRPAEEAAFPSGVWVADRIPRSRQTSVVRTLARATQTPQWMTSPVVGVR